MKKYEDVNIFKNFIKIITDFKKEKKKRKL